VVDLGSLAQARVNQGAAKRTRASEKR